MDAPSFRFDGGVNGRVMVGYGAIWGAMSLSLGGFKEVIRRGAFRKTIAQNDLRAFWNHNSDFVPGRQSSGTLFLEEDHKGLRVRILPPNVPWALSLMESISRRDISGMSFSFTVPKAGDRWMRAGADGFPVRELLEVVAYEVSPCSQPAYPDTEMEILAANQTRHIEHPPRSLDLRRRRLRLLEFVA